MLKSFTKDKCPGPDGWIVENVYLQPYGIGDAGDGRRTKYHWEHSGLYKFNFPCTNLEGIKSIILSRIQADIFMQYYL